MKDLARLLPLLRLFLGALFIYSGVMKTIDPGTFQNEIANFQILPWIWATAFGALFLPYLEIVSGLALFRPKSTRGAALILAALMVIFIVAIVAALLREIDVTCGCFGASDSTPSYPLWIIRNLLILTGLLIVYRAQSRKEHLDEITE